MKVKLLVARSGPAGSQNIGDEIEVSPEEAQRMAAKGQCELMRATKPEKAVKRAKSEKAVK